MFIESISKYLMTVQLLLHQADYPILKNKSTAMNRTTKLHWFPIQPVCIKTETYPY